jgi:hypothetical protein
LHECGAIAKKVETSRRRELRSPPLEPRQAEAIAARALDNNKVITA